jgi:hypothetical protein
VFVRPSIVLITTVVGALSRDRDALGCAGHQTSMVGFDVWVCDRRAHDVSIRISDGVGDG